MSADVVGSWAIGPGNVDLRQKKGASPFHVGGGGRTDGP
jgi:hypothetical protein